MVDSASDLGWPLGRGAARAVLGLAALALVGLAAGWGGFASDLAAAEAWWLAMVAAALALGAASLGTAWRGAGLIAALGLAGACAQLALNQPLWFQSVVLRPTSWLGLGCWAAIGLQALGAGVAVALRPGLGRLVAAARGLGLWRLALLGLCLALVSIGAMRRIADHDYGGMTKQLIVAGGFLAINLATLIAVAVRLPEAGLSRLCAGVAAALSLPSAEPAERRLDRAWPLLVAAWVVAASALLAWFVFQRMPHVPDEVAYLFQAKYFAVGHLSLPPPPAGGAFAYDFLSVQGGRWFSIFPPGWPAVLALGVRVGAGWLVNPLLAGLSILAAHAVVSRLATRGMANLVVLLMAVSPWFLALSGSLMSHTLTLALLLAGWLLLLSARDAARGRTLKALLAGAAMGLLFLTRPVDGLVAGGLTGLWTLSLLRRQGGLRIVVAYGLGCLMLGALIFPYNQHLVGDPLLTPIEDYYNRLWHPGSNRLGFGADIGPANGWSGIDPWRGHSPLEALAWTQLNAYALNVELFGWSVGSLALVFAHLVWGRWKGLDLAMAAVVGAIVGAIALYWFNDAYNFGPRYWFVGFVPLVWLSARGAQSLAGRLLLSGGEDAVRRFAAVLAMLALFGGGAFTTWRAATRYFEFRSVHADYRALAGRPELAGALVLLEAGAKQEFASAFALNPAEASSPAPLFARELGAGSDAAVTAAYPNRPVYHVAGRTPAGARPRIVSGPVR